MLIGASMGGALVLKAAEQLKPRALVLVCSAIPAGVAPVSSPKEYPEIMKWAGGPYEETVAAMPDSEEAIRRIAHSRWRDESGAVLRAIAAGMKADRPECPTLCVIPEGDDSIAPGRQQALASWAQADTLRFQGMSHVGPLLFSARPRGSRGSDRLARSEVRTNWGTLATFVTGPPRSAHVATFVIGDIVKMRRVLQVDRQPEINYEGGAFQTAPLLHGARAMVSSTDRRPSWTRAGRRDAVRALDGQARPSS